MQGPWEAMLTFSEDANPIRTRSQTQGCKGTLGKLLILTLRVDCSAEDQRAQGGTSEGGHRGLNASVASGLPRPEEGPRLFPSKRRRRREPGP